MEKKQIMKKDDEKLPIVAKTVVQVGISGVDFYTFGHIIMGLIGFTIMANILDTAGAFSFVQLGAVVWELIENIILYKIGLKFEERRDSGLNAILDIAFMDIGAGISFYLFVLLYENYGFPMEIFVAVNILLALSILILFYIMKKKVLSNTLRKKYERLLGADEEMKENIYLAQIYNELLEEKVEKVKKRIRSKKIDYDLL